MPSKVYDALYEWTQMSQGGTYPDTVQVPAWLMAKLFLVWETGTLAQSVETMDELKEWLAFYLGVDPQAHAELGHSAQRQPIPAPPRQPSYRDRWNRMGLHERRRISQEVFERDEWTCRHCGATDRLTIDHIIPLIRGGTNDPDNLQTLCKSCNSTKKDKMLCPTLTK